MLGNSRRMLKITTQKLQQTLEIDQNKQNLHLKSCDTRNRPKMEKIAKAASLNVNSH